MLRITQSSNAAGAASYFDEGLQRSDYYTKEEHSIGQWNGKLAERMGLQGEIQRDDFVALCHNQNPTDGSQLTPRQKTNRKAGYDLTFSVPKSASVAWAVGGDERIRHAFEQSVEATMRELEQNMRTQTGQGKQKQHTPTGEMIWGGFTHRTARPINGIPSPHLHRHCFAMNVTWNEQKQRYQAGEFGDIKRKANYYEAAFHARMAHAVKQLGYTIERHGRSWEIAGIDRSVIETFSPRTREIEQRAKQEAQANGSITAKQKDRLGSITRESKTSGTSWSELQTTWKGWMKQDESEAVTRTVKATEQTTTKATDSIKPEEAVERARSHLFERKSATRHDQLAMQALHRGYGDLLPEQIDQAIKERSDFHQRDYRGDRYITTTEAVQTEIDMIKQVRKGRGAYAPLHASYTPKADYLNDEQREAIQMTLGSRNQVMIVAGGAGVGKTTLVKEIRDAVAEQGKAFVGIAPSSKASRDVMRSEGFEKADTMAQLIHNPKMQGECRDGVIWCDEAGMIGNKDMNKLLTIAQEQNARLLLTGDTRQHHSVTAGDALRILEKEANIPVARVHKIQRQRNSLAYKKAVRMAADGKIDGALHQLDKMGDVIELKDRKERINQLIQDYSDSTKGGKTGLIVSPTHRESQLVTEQLREQLRTKGQLDEKERPFTRLKATNWTEEQKTDPQHYKAQGLIMEFHQNAQSHSRGERWQLSPIDLQPATTLQAQNATGKAAIPLSLSKRYTIYEEESISLAKGDRIRITKGGKTREGSRLNNGDLFTVKGFTKDGHIKLHTGKTLTKDFGHIAYGYCSTSHSSQGKTVDQVFIAQSTTSLPASSRQQFYVSISRGRERCRIYTDDKRELEQAVKPTGDRMTAREIAGLDHRRRRGKVQPSREKNLQKKQSQHYGNTREL